MKTTKYILSIAFAVIALVTVNTFSQYGPNETFAGAKTTKSNGSGSWCSGSTWSDGVPDPVKDSIVVRNNDSVNAQCVPNLVIGSSATLIVKGCSKLVVQNLEFANGSKIIVEPCATLVVLGDLKNRNNSVDVLINGDMIVNGYIDNGNGAEITGSGTITADSVTGYCCVMGMDPDTIQQPTYIADSTQGTALPVELLYFKLTGDGESVLAEWSVASETNNDHFTLLKSADLVSWKAVTTVPGAGNSNSAKTYEYSDTYADGEIYYMLKQTDFDGHAEILSIKSVHLIGTEPRGEIKVYPNPAKRGQYILVCCAIVNSASVTDVNGRDVQYDRWDNTFVFRSSGVFVITVNNRATVKVVVD